MEFAIILAGIALFSLASLLWGKDSQYSMTDAEWDRRRTWRGFTHTR